VSVEWPSRPVSYAGAESGHLSGLTFGHIRQWAPPFRISLCGVWSNGVLSAGRVACSFARLHLRQAWSCAPQLREEFERQKNRLPSPDRSGQLCVLRPGYLSERCSSPGRATNAINNTADICSEIQCYFMIMRFLLEFSTLSGDLDVFQKVTTVYHNIIPTA